MKTRTKLTLTAAGLFGIVVPAALVVAFGVYGAKKLAQTGQTADDAAHAASAATKSIACLSSNVTTLGTRVDTANTTLVTVSNALTDLSGTVTTFGNQLTNVSNVAGSAYNIATNTVSTVNTLDNMLTGTSNKTAAIYTELDDVSRSTMTLSNNLMQLDGQYSISLSNLQTRVAKVEKRRSAKIERPAAAGLTGSVPVATNAAPVVDPQKISTSVVPSVPPASASSNSLMGPLSVDMNIVDAGVKQFFTDFAADKGQTNAVEKMAKHLGLEPVTPMITGDTDLFRKVVSVYILDKDRLVSATGRGIKRALGGGKGPYANITKPQLSEVEKYANMSKPELNAWAKELADASGHSHVNTTH